METTVPILNQVLTYTYVQINKHFGLNLFMPDDPTLVNWTSPFPFLGLLGGIFHFIQI